MACTHPLLAAIDLASPGMLGWLALAAIPWLVNLWNRRRHVETSWAAVALLAEAVRQRSRRLRLREWLLLALRTAILALVVLAAARPQWRDAAAAARAESRTHQVLVIDRSFSMATEREGRTRLDRAREQARQVIDAAPAGDLFTVLSWGADAENPLGGATFDHREALAAVDAVTQSDSIAAMPPALRAIEAAFGEARQRFPEIARAAVMLISDSTATTWAPSEGGISVNPPPAADADSPSAILAQIKSKAAVEVVSVDDGVRDNLAVVDAQAEPASPSPGEACTVSVRLQAFGDRSWQAVPIELLIDGEPMGQQPATVAAGKNAVLKFQARLPDAGYHIIEARVPDDADPLSVDNRRWLALEARGSLRVVGFAEVDGAGEEVARALNPRHTRGSSIAGGIAVELAPIGSLFRTDLSAFDAVYLANVAGLSDREQQQLRRYVADGGAAVIILGDRSDPAQFNRLFSAPPNAAATAMPTSDAPPPSPLLPVQIAASPVAGAWRFDPLDYRHPVLAAFAGRSRSGLLGLRASHYFPATLTGPDAAVAMAFDSGDPALVIGDYGAGRVALVTTNPALARDAEPWSNLAVSPSFLPLVRELFAHLTTARRTERLNLLVDEPLQVSSAADLGAGAATSWETPAGNVASLPAIAPRRGVYRREAPPSASAAPAVSSAALALAVNVDPRESDLATLDAARVLSGAGTASAPNAAEAPAVAYQALVDLSPWLLAVAAALLIVELAVAWSLGRGWA